MGQSARKFPRFVAARQKPLPGKLGFFERFSNALLLRGLGQRSLAISSDMTGNLLTSDGFSLSPVIHVEELRGSTRFPKEPDTDFAALWRQPGEELLVEVFDESLTGIGLILADASRFPVGTEATIVYHGTTLHGVVRNLAPRGDGRCLVGFATRAGLPPA